MTTKTANGKGGTTFRLHAPAKLDIAAGQSKQEGFTGIDIAPVTDIQHDLTVFPWPLEPDSVEEAFCSHYVEHIPIADNGFFRFFDEVFRVLKDQAQIRLVYPHSRSDRAFQDPTHTRFIPEATWAYLSRQWRNDNKLDHYPVACNFEIQQIFYSGFHGDWGLRDMDARNFALAHYWNVAADVVVDLKAVKSELSPNPSNLPPNGE